QQPAGRSPRDRDRHRIRPGRHRRGAGGAQESSSDPVPAAQEGRDRPRAGASRGAAGSAAPAAAAAPDPDPAHGSAGRKPGHGNSDLHPAANGLMRKFGGVALAAAVVLGAWAFALADQWPWERLPPAPAPVIRRTSITLPDTLHPGESLGDLFGR